MGLIEAIVYGVVQGLTEFLPISSTAHVRIVPTLLGRPDPGADFTAAIQLGTLLAVLIYFARDLAGAGRAWFSTFRRGATPTPESRLAWAIVVGTVPICVLGYVLKEPIETTFRSLTIVAAMLIGMGLVLAGADRVGARTRALSDVRPLDGLWVGMWQAIALVPGASRSGSTIAGALFAGFDRATAARFSFLLSVPAIFIAGVFSLKAHSATLLGDLLVPVLVANVVAFFTGYASIAFLLRFLQTRSTAVFVVYRCLVGAALIAAVAGGALDPLAGLPARP